MGVSMNKTTPKEFVDIQVRRRSYRRMLWLAAVVGLCIWSFLVLLNGVRFGWTLSGEHAVWGQFGDYLGGVLNPVFAFAAFLILLCTLYDQRLHIEEERETRTLQDFENTFFQLLHRFNDVLSDMRFARDVNVRSDVGLLEVRVVATQGRGAMRSMFLTFKEGCESHPPHVGVDLVKYYGERNSDFYQEWEHELGINFRTLYHIFRFIDSSSLSFEKRVQYADIAPAQLSAYELAMIFYNGLWGEGRSGFRSLIEKYGLLKHLKKQTVVKESDLANSDMYAELAFVRFQRRLEIWHGIEPNIQYDLNLKQVHHCRYSGLLEGGRPQPATLGRQRSVGAHRNLLTPAVHFAQVHR
jgi:hypothetical protein